MAPPLQHCCLLPTSSSRLVLLPELTDVPIALASSTSWGVQCRPDHPSELHTMASWGLMNSRAFTKKLFRSHRGLCRTILPPLFPSVLHDSKANTTILGFSHSFLVPFLSSVYTLCISFCSICSFLL